MEFIENQIDPNRLESAASYFFIKKNAIQHCNAFTLYPDPHGKLLFNFSDDRVLLNGIPLPPVVFVRVSERLLDFGFDSGLKLFGIRVKSSHVRRDYVERGGNDFVPVANYEDLYHSAKSLFDEKSDFEENNDLIMNQLPELIKEFVHRETDLIDLLESTGKVGDIARKHRKSIRQIERVYKERLGLTPRGFASLSRFESIKKRIWKDPGVSLTRLAHEFEFADQSHFNREFKRMSRLTPKEFAKRVMCLQARQ